MKNICKKASHSRVTITLWVDHWFEGDLLNSTSLIKKKKCNTLMIILGV